MTHYTPSCNSGYDGRGYQGTSQNDRDGCLKLSDDYVRSNYGNDAPSKGHMSGHSIYPSPSSFISEGPFVPTQMTSTSGSLPNPETRDVPHLLPFLSTNPQRYSVPTSNSSSFLPAVHNEGWNGSLDDNNESQYGDILLNYGNDRVQQQAPMSQRAVQECSSFKEPLEYDNSEDAVLPVGYVNLGSFDYASPPSAVNTSSFWPEGAPGDWDSTVSIPDFGHVTTSMPSNVNPNLAAHPSQETALYSLYGQETLPNQDTPFGFAPRPLDSMDRKCEIEWGRSEGDAKWSPLSSVPRKTFHTGVHPSNGYVEWGRSLQPHPVWYRAEIVPDVSLQTTQPSQCSVPSVGEDLMNQFCPSDYPVGEKSYSLENGTYARGPFPPSTQIRSVETVSATYELSCSCHTDLFYGYVDN